MAGTGRIVLVVAFCVLLSKALSSEGSRNDIVYNLRTMKQFLESNHEAMKLCSINFYYNHLLKNLLYQAFLSIDWMTFLYTYNGGL